MPINLYYMRSSPPSNAVILFAHTLGIQVNLIHLDLDKYDQLTAAFLQLNPERTIPTLVDNGFVTYESRAILIYLAEKFSDSLYPADPEQRARVNQRLFFDLGTFYERLGDYYLPLALAKGPAVPDNTPKIAQAFEFLEHYLCDQVYVAGDALTVADFPLAVSVLCLDGLGYDFSVYGNVVRWYRHLAETLPGWALVAENMKEFKHVLADVV